MKRVAIFGCGSAGKRACLHYRTKCTVTAFLDNDRSRHGTELLGVPVFDPQRFNYLDVDQVLIASMYLDQIVSQLLALGVPSAKIEYVSDHIMLNEVSSGALTSPALSALRELVETFLYLPFRLLRRFS